jgi:transposase
MMALAVAELKRALEGPPTLADKWPFANPPGLQASLDAEKARTGGRPSAVQPHQVVRLARFVRLGDSVAKAAAKVGLKRSTAQNILAGQHRVAHHPAVTATGLYLPPLKKKGGAA